MAIVDLNKMLGFENHVEDLNDLMPRRDLQRRFRWIDAQTRGQARRR